MYGYDIDGTFGAPLEPDASTPHPVDAATGFAGSISNLNADTGRGDGMSIKLRPESFSERDVLYLLIELGSTHEPYDIQIQLLHRCVARDLVEDEDTTRGHTLNFPSASTAANPANQASGFQATKQTTQQSAGFPYQLIAPFEPLQRHHQSSLRQSVQLSGRSP